MRTVILIVIGAILAALVARFAPAAHRLLATGLFTLAWLGFCAWNLQTGLSHGYTLAEELPIHLALFGVPAALAWGLWWWSRG